MQIKIMKLNNQPINFIGILFSFASSKAKVKADSQTIFEVDLYQGSPEPKISKRFSLPS